MLQCDIEGGILQCSFSSANGTVIMVVINKCKKNSSSIQWSAPNMRSIRWTWFLCFESDDELDLHESIVYSSPRGLKPGTIWVNEGHSVLSLLPTLKRSFHHVTQKWLIEWYIEL